ncbi:cobalt-precorrin 5A hydrolase [Leptospira borgpetersenii]|uniref:Cobalamin biosynthesis protein n=1 Tax=Leptospira borgpetersenii str. Brem 328 TaxID=1049780 RepID=A0ABC9SFN8_LEPBO|nr:cobalamin biosynthesis protein [Leptospira borgpetersenii]EMN12936.1 cobalamin biosynthesis protein [Leptospira borgpetersenii str. Brem 307]EMN16610.1 cobalamin biosynthesis protein [Leptospira borgpetersenii str. Brem 328]
MKRNRKPYSVFAITKHGLEIANRIQSAWEEVDLFVSSKFIREAPPNSKPLSLPMNHTLREVFQEYDCHIFIISVGAVVRMIAPLLENKKVDPAVLCVDDRANFSICVLSGHIGRGNFFTEKLSQILSNIPVITTASDVSGTLTVDILGRELGWVLEHPDRNVTRGCAAVVNEARVLFVQETGEPNWWPLDKNLPKGVEYSTSLNQVRSEDYEILLIATDRNNLQKTHQKHYENSILYHPKSLILGLGCDRNIPLETVENGIYKVLNENGLAIQSVKAIASVDLKKNESAFLSLSLKYGWELITFSPEELDRVSWIQSPSKVVKNFVGTKSVSEAASLLASGANSLLVSKQKYKELPNGKNLTIAVSRIPFPKRPFDPITRSDFSINSTEEKECK